MRPQEIIEAVESGGGRISLNDERLLNQLPEPLHLPQDRYEVAVSEGAVSEALMDIIAQRHIDVAVMGTHGRRAFKKLMMGSVAEEVFRLAPCPVLTVGTNAWPADSSELRHILYPVHFAPDYSEAAA